MARDELGSTSDHRRFMELALDEMAKSVNVTPKVGAVLVANGEVVTQAHREPRIHAERSAIEQALEKGIDLKGSTIYTTLEPCVPLDKKHVSCAELISGVGISSVVIGRYDANSAVNRLGWRMLRDAGIRLRDFDADLRARIDYMNTSFTDHFEVGYGPDGGAKFDYTLNGGKFEFRFSKDDARSIDTRWGMIGKAAINASAISPAMVAVPKYADEFGQIDDPTAHDFNRHWQRIEVGEIAVFVNEDWSVLVKVIEVENGPDGARWGETSLATSVKIKWVVRSVAERCNA